MTYFTYLSVSNFDLPLSEGMLMFICVMLLGLLGAFFGIALAIAKKAFHVDKDQRIELIEEVLPGANCGGCGFPGCSGYAEAVVLQGANISACAPGGSECANAIAKIMGQEASTKEPDYAVIHCNGHNVDTRFKYNGINDCRAAHALQSGFKGCPYGCLGIGTCAEACPFGAIAIGEDGFPVIIEENCVACGKCVAVCPRNLIEIHSKSKMVHVLCKSNDKGAAVKKACEVGCIGCMKCKKACPVEAIEINKFLSEINYEKCISCGKCVKECPTNAIGNFRKRRKPVKKAPVKTESK